MNAKCTSIQGTFISIILYINNKYYFNLVIISLSSTLNETASDYLQSIDFYLVLYNSHKYFIGICRPCMILFNFYLLLPISRESIVLGSNFRNGDFDDFTHFEIPRI